MDGWMDGWMNGWRIVNDLSSKAISGSNGFFFHPCYYITWVLYNNNPPCKFPINFGFWLHAGFNVTLLINDKVSLRTHDTQNIMSYITVFWGHVHGKKNRSKIFALLWQKKEFISENTTQTKLQKTCWLELHQGSSIGIIQGSFIDIIQGSIPWWWVLYTWRSLICYYSI